LAETIWPIDRTSGSKPTKPISDILKKLKSSGFYFFKTPKIGCVGLDAEIPANWTKFFDQNKFEIIF